MHTFADLAHALNRSPVWLRELQTRFALPVLEGAAYPDAYAAFLRTVVHLRTFGVEKYRPAMNMPTGAGREKLMAGATVTICGRQKNAARR